MQALGARFDAEASLEAFAFEESALGVTVTTAEQRAYIDQLKRRATAARAAFPRSLVVQWTNWNLQEPYGTEVFSFLRDSGLGAGGPDTSPLHLTQATPHFSTFKGQIPILMGVQPTFLTWQEHPIAEGKLTLDQVFSFLVDDAKGIHATHAFWWYFVDAKGPYDYQDTVALIQKNGARINSACPANLTCDL